MELFIQNFSIKLLPQKAIWVKELKALIIADLHLGKASYFQKNAIPIPSSVHEKDMEILQQLIGEEGAEKLYILGDLFHHGKKLGNTLFEKFCRHNPNLSIVWVMGNHDQDRALGLPNLEVVQSVVMGNLLLVHEVVESDTQFVIAGHEHPAIKLKTKRDTLKMPCFVQALNYLILPSFGSFTGNKIYRKEAKNHLRFYSIAGGKVLEV